MKNFVQKGAVLSVTASAAVLSGDVVVVGAHIGVANHDAASGAPLEVSLEGVFQLPKATGAAWTVGMPLMWDKSAGAFAAVTTPASGDVTAAGLTAFAAAASADAVGLVRFSGIPGTVTA